MRRWAKRMLVYASLTDSEMSWRWSSTLSSATSWSLRAASVAARFLPKSKRSTLRGEAIETIKTTALAIRRVVIGEFSILLRYAPGPRITRALCESAVWRPFDAVASLWIHGGRAVDTFFLDARYILRARLPPT